jgi:hypothetical protein
MRLVGVALVRNEADIIEAFVRTNLVMLDALVVFIHKASDGTREILLALAGEGLPLTLGDVNDDAFDQERHTNAAARMAFKDLAADFVFPIDADEFVRAESRASLERSLAAIPDGHAGALPWYTYVPTEGDKPSPNVLERLTHRIPLTPGSPFDLRFCKVVVGRWYAENTAARIVEGNHAVFGPDQIRTVRCADAALCHYPVRSTEQVAAKAALGWLGQLVSGRPVEASSVSAHWRQLFEQLKRNGKLTQDDVDAFVCAYVPESSRGNAMVADPLPHRVNEMRYADLQRIPNLIQALLERAEQFAKVATASRRSSLRSGFSLPR